MEEIIKDFTNGKEEIDCYYKFIEQIASGKYAIRSVKQKRDYCLDNRIIKILKANMFLLLYNLIESTVDNTVKCVCEEIGKENLKYEIMVDGLKRQWATVHAIKHLQSPNFEKLKDGIKTILDKTINECIKFEEGYEIEYSDNIDNKVLFQIARDFGFKLKFAKSLKGGHNINEIKKKRNWLAHGNITFTDCGQNTSVEELKLFKEDTYKILDKFLKVVKVYITEQKYKIN